MTKDEFLTIRWNNILTFTLGIPALIYAGIALFTSVLSDLAAFWGFAAIGALYWIVVEQHSVKQFAWQRKKLANYVPIKKSLTNRLTFIAYNVVYWIPLVLPFTKLITFRMGFILFFVIIVLRAIANFYRNNFLKVEQAEAFPFRSPW